jgi:carbon-monoxide dehydrogenase medium subunit
MRAQEAEQLLLGEVASGEVLAEAARRAADASDPPSDIHASAAFRRKLAAYTARQAIDLAAQRAGGV